MVQTKSLLTRTTAIVSVIALASAALVPAIFMARVNAGIPTSRSITLSTSAGGATDVTYDVAFTTDDGGTTIQGIVIEFCDSTPIIGDSSCTTPSGFDINEAGLAVSDTIAGGAFTVNAATDTNTLMLTRTDATSIAASTALTIALGGGGGSDGVTNPTPGNHTFYARILTFADDDDDGDGCSNADDNATCYASATPRTYIDAGGVALSTANQLQITAKVQERLSFCVYIGSCTVDTAGAARTSSFNLGNTNGVLDPAGPFVDKTAEFDISTNALSGATVVMKGDTLLSGGFDITSSANSGMGAAGATAYTSNSGNEQFGMCLFESAGSGLTISAPYNNGGTPANCDTQTSQTSGTGSTGGAGTATFAFDRTAAPTASGDVIATKAAGTTSTGTLVHIGNVAFTTEAGIYQTTLTYVATGTY
jgi:hypothetical protein